MLKLHCKYKKKEQSKYKSPNDELLVFLT